jgi:hypothetical protein
MSEFLPVPGQDMKLPIIRYTGKSKMPQWMDKEQGERADFDPCGTIASEKQ